MVPTPSTTRVLHVAHHCLPHVGGLETVVAAETEGLAAKGWDVSLLSSAHTVDPGVGVEHGIRTVRVRAWNGLESFGVPFPVFSPRLLLTAWREVRRADVVHIHDVLYLSSWVAAVWCWMLRTPYVVHRHVAFVHHPSRVVTLVQRSVVGTVGRTMLRRAAAVLAIDEHVAQGVRPVVRSTDRVQVLGNGVDPETFRPATEDERRRARADLGLPQDRILILFVGRFVPKKGFDHVVEAASADYDLVFVGGDRPPGLADPRMHFLGSIPAQDMPRIYGCADLMVVASVGECPLTVIESLSSGLPLVANDDPALHSTWTAGPGVRFVDMAAGGLREALEELARNPGGRQHMAAAARVCTEEAFAWDAHLHWLETVYRRALADG